MNLLWWIGVSTLAVAPAWAQAFPAGLFISDNNPSVVPSLPFSARQTTETSNIPRGVSRPTASDVLLYRDSLGRRRIGGEGPDGATISDPVSGFRYVLNPLKKIAARYKLAAPFPRDSLSSPIHMQVLEDRPGIVYNRPIMDGAVGGIGLAGGHYHTTYEIFAQRMVEGVAAEGKRITTTLEVGALGNDHEIVVEDESWFSPQLHVLVLARVSDPRIGTTINRLVDVSLTEPDPKLFIVPPDYVIEDRTSVVP